MYNIHLGCLHPVACVRSRCWGGLFCLRNVTIVGHFYYLLLLNQASTQRTPKHGKLNFELTAPEVINQIKTSPNIVSTSTPN
jgi:hypothetical protein